MEEPKDFVCPYAEDMREVKQDIKTIKENHLSHMQVSLEKVSTDMDWVKKAFWVIFAGICGIVFSLIKKL
jgi:hypothetical protein